MPILGAKVDISGPLAACQNLRREQLPWTIARALTKTAQYGQTAGRRIEGLVFKLRNDWTVRNTKIKAATKSSLMAVVFTDTANYHTGAPDYLERQQDGGERVPVNGRKHVAIPTNYLRRLTGNGPIPDRLRPKTMLQFATIGPPTKGQARKRRGAIRDGMYFFLVTLHSGAYAILGRYVTDKRAYPMYILVTEAHLRGRFPLEKTVIEICDTRFQENFKTAAIETLGNDLLRGSGLRVKL